MITPDDLLTFTSDLVNDATGTETSARRAISGAYYALFHMIAQAGSALLAGDPGLRDRLARSYDHSALSKAAQEISSPQARGLAGTPLDPRLIQVATAFRRLRGARERADYDLSATISWKDAEEAFETASDACRALNEIGAHTDTAAFLLAPLMQRRRG